MNPLYPGVGGPSLYVDLYELTMARAYREEGLVGEAVFELYFRRLPQGRNYVVAAGIADVVDFLESFRFGEDDLFWLRERGGWSEDFIEFLRDLRFTGDVWAVEEGTVVFPFEPILQVVAPIVEAQLVETYVLNQIHLQSVVASKAARMVQVARGRPLVEFGARRAHGLDAGVKAVRASYLAGFEGTSNLLAAKAYGIPAYGTMAHSYVQAHDAEMDAFSSFAQIHPRSTLLVDTYGTEQGVRRVVDLARALGERFDVAAIRLDSGDLAALSRKARAVLDAAGLRGVEIFASSDLDEHAIEALLAAGSPIDGFGVGTKLVVSADAPSLDVSYKLVEYEGRGRTKLATGKPIFPGRKQVFRRSEGGRLVEDVVAGRRETVDGEPLLRPVVMAGRRLSTADLSLATARARAREQLASLPDELRSLAPAKASPVRISEALRGEFARLQDLLG